VIFKVCARAPLVAVAPSKVPIPQPSKLGFSEWAAHRGRRDREREGGEREREREGCPLRESSFNFQIDPDFNRKRTPTTSTGAIPLGGTNLPLRCEATLEPFEGGRGQEEAGGTGRYTRVG